MSGLPGRFCRLFLYPRMPDFQSADLRSSSGKVSLALLPRIAAVTAGELADGGTSLVIFSDLYVCHQRVHRLLPSPEFNFCYFIEFRFGLKVKLKGITFPYSILFQ